MRLIVTIYEGDAYTGCDVTYPAIYLSKDDFLLDLEAKVMELSESKGLVHFDFAGISDIALSQVWFRNAYSTEPDEYKFYPPRVYTIEEYFQEIE